MKNLLRLRLTWIALACATAMLLAPVATLAEEPAKPAPPAEAKPDAKAKADADACKNEKTGYFNTLEDFYAYGPLLPAAEVAAAEAEPAAIEWTESAAESADEKAAKPEPKKSESD